MTTVINKQKLVNQLFALQSKGSKGSAPQGRQVLEQFLYAICREGVTRDELMAALREHGVEDVGDVRLAVLEVDGDVSVVPRQSTVHRSHRPFRRTKSAGG